jgi:hypothetical protein
MGQEYNALEVNSTKFLLTLIAQLHTFAEDVQNTNDKTLLTWKPENYGIIGDRVPNSMRGAFCATYHLAYTLWINEVSDNLDPAIPEQAKMLAFLEAELGQAEWGDDWQEYYPSCVQATVA